MPPRCDVCEPCGTPRTCRACSPRECRDLIADAEAHAPAVSPSTSTANHVTRLRELDRVADEVREDLADALAIALDLAAAVRTSRGCRPAAAREIFELLARRVEQIARGSSGLDIELELRELCTATHRAGH